MVHLIALVESVKRNARNSSTARALVDAMVVRMAMSEQLADVGRLLAGGGVPAKNAEGGSRGHPAPDQPAHHRTDPSTAAY
ncbi:hypothetical protein ABWH91_02605 [Phycisphaerales bacterium ac7]